MNDYELREFRLKNKVIKGKIFEERNFKKEILGYEKQKNYYYKFITYKNSVLIIN